MSFDAAKGISAFRALMTTGLAMLGLNDVAAQPSWTASGCPIYLGGGPSQLYFDTVYDALLAIGQTELVTWDGQTGSAISRLHNGAWDTLGIFSHATSAAIRWGDSLIVAGHFYSINGEPIARIARWDGSEWLPFGTLNEGETVFRFRLLNGELYAVGTFNYFDGHLCNGVAKRVGNEWVNVGNLEFESWGQVTDIALYQGQLVICGTISAPDHLGRDIMVYDGATWSRLMETAVVGGFCSAISLIEYQGDLVITGPIDVNAGNVGHSIQRWDGTQWHAMGTGLTLAPNDFTYISGGHELAIHNGLLYVCGGFYYAGGVPASGIATWDGTNWCGLGGDLALSVRSMAWYHDTLYVNPAGIADGQQVNGVAKYVGTYPDTCTQNSTGSLETTPAINVYLNVAVQGNGVEARLPVGAAARDITLHDVQGRFLERVRGTAVRFTAPHATGLYVVRAEGFRPVRVVVP